MGTFLSSRLSLLLPLVSLAVCYFAYLRLAFTRLPYQTHWDEYNVITEAVHLIQTHSLSPLFTWYPPFVANCTAVLFWLVSQSASLLGFPFEWGETSQWVGAYPVFLPLIVAQGLTTLAAITTIGLTLVLARKYCSHWCAPVVAIPLFQGLHPFNELAYQYLNVDLWANLIAVTVMLLLRQAPQKRDNLWFRGVLMGVLSGVAFACKYPYGFVGVLCAASLLLSPPKQNRIAIWMALLGSAVVTVVLTAPQLILEYSRYSNYISHNLVQYSKDRGATTGIPRLFIGLWRNFGILMVFIPFGIDHAVRKDKKEWSLFLIAFLMLSTAFLWKQLFYDRNFLFVYVFLIVLICAGIDNFLVRFHSWLRAPVIIGSLVLSIYYMTSAKGIIDSRVELRRWLFKHSTDSRKTLIPKEFNLRALGPLPPGVSEASYAHGEHLVALDSGRFAQYVRVPGVKPARSKPHVADYFSIPIYSPCRVLKERWGKQPNLMTYFHFSPPRVFPMGNPRFQICETPPNNSSLRTEISNRAKNS